MKSIILGALLLYGGSAIAGDFVLRGLYSFEQTTPRAQCGPGGCPVNQTSVSVGAGSCIAVGHTDRGVSCVLTAGHNISKDPRTSYFIVNSEGRKYPAAVVCVDRECDIAALAVNRKLSSAAIAASPARVGERIRISGLLSRRFEESYGVASEVNEHQIRIEGVWAHVGLSGGAVETSRGLVGIFYGQISDSKADGLGTGYRCVRAAMNCFERNHGALRVVGERPEHVRKVPLKKPPEKVEPVPDKQVEKEPRTFEPQADELAKLRSELDSLRRELRLHFLSEDKVPHLDLADIRSEINTSERIDKIETRIEKMSSTLVMLGSSAAGASEGLADRLKVLEDRKPPEPVDLSELEARLSKVENQKTTYQFRTEGKIVDSEDYAPGDLRVLDLPNFAEIQRRLKALESVERRVLLVDGKPKEGGIILADDTYPQGEPLIIDIRKLKELAK